MLETGRPVIHTESSLIRVVMVAVVLVLVCTIVLGCFSKSDEIGVLDNSGSPPSAQSMEAIQVPLGLIDVGQSSTYSLVLENDTGDLATIQGSHASCGCVSFSSDVTSIKPWSSCKASCVITPGSPGPISQSLRIDTDSDLLGNISFQFRGLAKGIWSDTSVVNYDKVGTDQSHRKVIVFIAGFPEAKLDSIRISDTRFTITKQAIQTGMVPERRIDQYGLSEGLLDGTIKAWELDISWIEKEGPTGCLTALLSVTSREGGALEIPFYFTASNMHFVPKTLMFTGVVSEVEVVREAMCKWTNSVNHFSLNDVDITTGNGMVKACFVNKDSGVFLQCRVMLDQPTDMRLLQGHVTGAVRGVEVFRVPYIITFRQ